MKQPKGCISQGRENLVCAINKPLYRLKQFPHNWNRKLVNGYACMASLKPLQIITNITYKKNRRLFLSYMLMTI